MTIVRDKIGFRIVGFLWFIAMLYSCCRTVKPAASAQVSAFDDLRSRLERVHARTR